MFSWLGFKNKKKTHILDVPAEDTPSKNKQLTEDERLALFMTTPQAQVTSKYVEKISDIINVATALINQASKDYSAELRECPPLPEELKNWKSLK